MEDLDHMTDHMTEGHLVDDHGDELEGEDLLSPHHIVTLKSVGILVMMGSSHYFSSFNISTGKTQPQLLALTLNRGFGGRFHACRIMLVFRGHGTVCGHGHGYPVYRAFAVYL